MEINHFSEDVLAKLGNYVYAYARKDGTIFYVGRGSTSERALSHLTESYDDGKSHNWNKLNEIDEDTQVFIIHSGMSEEEAQHCETTLINLCRYINPDLTNIKEGDKYRHKMLPAEEATFKVVKIGSLLVCILMKVSAAALQNIVRAFSR